MVSLLPRMGAQSSLSNKDILAKLSLYVDADKYEYITNKLINNDKR